MNHRRTCRFHIGWAVVALAAVVVALAAQSSAHSVTRRKRSIGQFGRMIRHSTRMEALLFNNYGNHCGSGGSSAAPAIDAIDECCREHDLCYERLAAGPCSSSFFGPYMTHYEWHVNADQQTIECADNEGCKLDTCTCDKAAAECFARHSASYDASNKHTSIWDWLI